MSDNGRQYWEGAVTLTPAAQKNHSAAPFLTKALSI
jgi:hypothetical protein